MRVSIQTDLTRIKNAKAAIKAAIEGKGVTVPDATLLDGMAALIESIQAGGGGGGGSGDVVLGEITITSNENVTLTDAIPVRSQAPKAYFWFEKGLDFSNTTHTKPRPLAFIAARKDGGTARDTAGSYAGAYVRTSSGSNSYSSGTINASNLFNRTSAATTDIYKIFSGNYKNGKLYFGVNNASGGFIEGRTYVWGVFPWDE